MRSGAISRTVELWKKSVVKNDYGEMAETWNKIKDLRAFVRRRSGRDQINSSENFYEIRIVVEIRNQHDIEEQDRIKYDGNMYMIEFIQPNYTQRWLTLICARINE